MSSTVKRAWWVALACGACSGQPWGDVDAGPNDAGAVDGSADAGPLDAGADAGSPDVGPPLPVAELCPSLAEATCARAEHCGWLQPAQRVACRRTQRVICENADNFGPAMRGLQTYDGVSARACVERTRALACAISPTATDDSCSRIITAQVALGEACTRSQQSCARGAACAAQAPEQCVCVPYVAEGGDCSYVSCTYGLSCVSDGGTPTCTARLRDGEACVRGADCTTGQCTPGLDGGSRCGYVPALESCNPNSSRSCAPTDYCRGLRFAEFGSLTLSDGTCTPRVTGACTAEQFDDGCPAGQWCADGRCATEVTLSVPLGGACLNDGDCTTGYCEGRGPFFPDGGPSVKLGRCGALLPPGSPCSAAGPPCAAPASCVSNACALPPAEGQPCSQLCTFLTFCPPNGTDRVCTAPRAAGEPCTNGLRCEEGLFCDSDGGTCSPPRPAGAPCTAAYQCQTDLCRTDAGQSASATRPGTCQPTCQ